MLLDICSGIAPNQHRVAAEEEKKKKKKKALYSSIATNPGSNDAESLPIAFD